MPPEYVDALFEAASDGISFDGFECEGVEEFRFETPSASLSGLSESALRDLAMGSPYVTNWYFWHAIAPQKEDRWTFLRWLERATEGKTVPERYDELHDGITRTWGQIEITVTLGRNGQRSYHLQHVDQEPRGNLENESNTTVEQYSNPGDAREIARSDENGRFRPLKTAPTLRSGWAFSGLDPSELVQTVDFLYPATIPNWYRERTGNLDVTHWRETVSRQTGIYQVVQTWDRGEGSDHVEWVTESCCVDSVCLKRREWHYDEETELDTPGGDGEFPCREPCSFVIAAARQFTKHHGQKTRTYELELTPPEKRQLETLIEAVADGRISEIRDAEFDDGANRYRARFLRASRFDEDGRFPDEPSDDS